MKFYYSSIEVPHYSSRFLSTALLRQSHPFQRLCTTYTTLHVLLNTSLGTLPRTYADSMGDGGPLAGRAVLLFPHVRRAVWGPALSYLPHQTLFSKFNSLNIERANVLNHDYCFPVRHYFSHCTFLAILEGSSHKPACWGYSSGPLHFFFFFEDVVSPIINVFNLSIDPRLLSSNYCPGQRGFKYIILLVHTRATVYRGRQCVVIKVPCSALRSALRG